MYSTICHSTFTHYLRVKINYHFQHKIANSNLCTKHRMVQLKNSGAIEIRLWQKTKSKVN